MKSTIEPHLQARSLRQTLIDMAASGQGESGANVDVLKRFLPLPGHARILDPQCMLIIGHRGAGKTELFRILREPGGPDAIAAASDRVDASMLERVNWCVGYSGELDRFANSMSLQRFAANHSHEDFQLIWAGYLLKTLAAEGIIESQLLPDGFDAASASLDPLLQAVERDLEPIIALLDNLNRRMEAEDRYVFITYDELDRVSSSNWDALAVIVRGLVQFWSANSRRWKRIRPKIFLRSDLYERSAIVGPDVSKISANRLRLSWSVRDLYALFFKRFVNFGGASVSDYLGQLLPRSIQHPTLGWLPQHIPEEAFRPPLERICGELMGGNVNKGRSFTWIPTHLQDAHGEVLPRSFLKLFEKAAEIETENARAKWPNLLDPTSLRGALDRVSLDRMDEIKDELPWIDVFQKHIAPLGIKVPIERRELQDKIRINWQAQSEERRAPVHNSYDLIQFLGEFGMFYTRKDGRVDVRDIYLKGLGLKRKGGVQRPF